LFICFINSSFFVQKGHYICDVWDEKNKLWKCFDDSLMEETKDGENLLKKRRKTAYILFYLFKEKNVKQ